MFLSKQVIRGCILKENLITGYEDLESQLTANGFDLRVCAFVEVLEAGVLAKEKKDNKPPVLGTAFVLEGYESRLNGYAIAKKEVITGMVSLKKLQPYLVLTCEKGVTPKNIMVVVRPRSSLFRFTQAHCIAGFSEAGYEGFWAFMILPFLDTKIELGARIVQATFAELKGEAHYAEQKETNYQGGKLF